MTVDGYNITNKHTVSATPTPVPGGDVTTTPIPGGEDAQKVIIAGEAIWDDENDKDGIRPEVIIINLKRNGETIGSKYVRESDGWSYRFENYAKTDASGNEYTYTITEDKVEGYETIVDGYSVINRHTPEQVVPLPEKTTISGVITWNDANDKDGIRPDGVTVKLYADGQLKEEKLVEPDRNGEWKYSFTGLDKSVPNKTNIQYTIAEEPVEGYTTTINGWNITNTHVPKTNPDHPTDSGKIDLAGAIVWDDQNDKDGIRPAEVTVNLLRNGMKVGSITIREADGWSWMFEGQAKAEPTEMRIPIPLRKTRLRDTRRPLTAASSPIPIRRLKAMGSMIRCCISRAKSSGLTTTMQKASVPTVWM